MGVMTMGWLSAKLEIVTPPDVGEVVNGVGAEHDHVEDGMGYPSLASSFDRLNDIAQTESPQSAKHGEVTEKSVSNPTGVKREPHP